MSTRDPLSVGDEVLARFEARGKTHVGVVRTVVPVEGFPRMVKAYVIDIGDEEHDYRVPAYMCRRAEAHRAVCRECGDEWPCEHERIVCEAHWAAASFTEPCRACGKPVSGGQTQVIYAQPTPEGEVKVAFHARKSAARCLREAIRYGESHPDHRRIRSDIR